MRAGPGGGGRGRSLRLVAALALVALAACGTLPESRVVAPPTGFPGFPAQAGTAGIWAEARFPTDQERRFGADLVALGLLPVELRVGRSDDAAEGDTPHLSAGGFHPHLYLQDGTVLEQVHAPRLVGLPPEVRGRLEAALLDPSLLVAWKDARPGLLLFRLDPGRVRVQGTRALSRRPGADRELDLLQSVLAFSVATEKGPVELRVGLRATAGGTP